MHGCTVGRQQAYADDHAEASALSLIPPCRPADTNAAIVCGMLGALHGAAAIPADLRTTVEGYEWSAAVPHGSRCVRPDRLLGKHLAALAVRLYEEAVQDAAAAAGQ